MNRPPRERAALGVSTDPRDACRRIAIATLLVGVSTLPFPGATARAQADAVDETDCALAECEPSEAVRPLTLEERYPIVHRDPELEVARAHVAAAVPFFVGVRLGLGGYVRIRGGVGIALGIVPARRSRFAIGPSVRLAIDSGEPRIGPNGPVSVIARFGLPFAVALGSFGESRSFREAWTGALTLEPALSFGRVDGHAGASAVGFGIHYGLGCGSFVVGAEVDRYFEFASPIASAVFIGLDPFRFARNPHNPCGG